MSGRTRSCFLWHLLMLIQPHITSTDRDTSLPLVSTARPLDAAGVGHITQLLCKSQPSQLAAVKYRWQGAAIIMAFQEMALCWLMLWEVEAGWDERLTRARCGCGGDRWTNSGVKSCLSWWSLWYLQAWDHSIIGFDFWWELCQIKQARQSLFTLQTWTRSTGGTCPDPPSYIPWYKAFSNPALLNVISEAQRPLGGCVIYLPSLQRDQESSRHCAGF